MNRDVMRTSRSESTNNLPTNRWTASFVGIVQRWYDLLELSERAEYVKHVRDSWDERARLERLGRRFGELVREQERLLQRQVEGMVGRCLADPALTRQGHLEKLGSKALLIASEKLISSAGLVIRDQLAANQRGAECRLIVDWKDAGGLACWDVTENRREFLIRNALKFAAKHFAGLADPIAATLAVHVANEWRSGLITLPQLQKIQESGTIFVYEWKNGELSIQDENDNDRFSSEPPLSDELKDALLLWLRDERQLADEEIQVLHRQPVPAAVWTTALSRVQDAARNLNPDVVEQVREFVNECAQFSGGDRRRFAAELGLTAFHILAAQIDSARAARIAHVAGGLVVESLVDSERKSADAIRELLVHASG